MPDRASAGQDAPFTELHRSGQSRLRRYFATHPVAMDIVLVLIYAVPAVAVGVYVRSYPVLAVTALAIVVLFARRHRPLLTLAGLTALTLANLILVGEAAGMEFALAVSVYTVAAAHRARTAWLAMAVTNVVIILVLLFGGGDELLTIDGEAASLDYRIGTATGTLVFTLAGMAIGTSVRNRRESLQRLLDHGNQLSLERDQQAQLAIAAERTRIAREMHDVVTHSVSVMVALADGANASLDRKPDQAAAALRELSVTGRSALADMRRILGLLRDGSVTSLAAPGPTADDPPVTATGLPAPTAPQPDDAEVTALISRFQAAGMRIRHTHTGPTLPGDAALQLVVYRIVQEALTNVLRHSPGASSIDVRTEVGAAEVTIIVENGPASPLASGELQAGTRSGHGLVGMRERAAVFDGSVSAAPTPDQGWRVEAVLRFVQEDT